MRVALTAISILAFITNATASAFLEPDNYLFSDPKQSGYGSAVLDALSPALDKSVKIQVVVRPSFEPEYLIGLREIDGRFELFKLEPEILFLGFNEIRSTGDGRLKGYRKINGNLVADEGYFTYPETTRSGDYTLAKTHYCETMIDADLATQLIKVWEVMLLDTRPPNPTDVAMLDGTAYHFSASMGGEMIAGKIRSPFEPSNTGRLVALSDSMKALCEKPSEDLVRQVQRIADSLHSLRPEWSATLNGRHLEIGK